MMRLRAARRITLVGAMITGLLLAGVTPALANVGPEEPPAELELVPEVTDAVTTNDAVDDADVVAEADVVADVDVVAEDTTAVDEDGASPAPEVYGESGPPASWNGSISGKILDPKKLIRPGEKLVVAAFNGRQFTEATLLNFVEEINGATSFKLEKLPRLKNITLIVAPAHQDLSRIAELGWTSAPGSTGTFDRSKLSYVDLSSKKDVTGITFTMKPGFADMYMSLNCCNKFYKEIMWMQETGLSTGVRVISSGDGDTTQHYRPKDTVTREAMAAFLYRLNAGGASAPAGYTIPARSPFADVPTNHKFYKEIAWMHKSGLSTGIKHGNTVVYAPKSGVSREAMAAFMYRMKKPNYTVTNTPHFSDVHPGHKFFTQIQWMYDSQLSTGVKQPSGKPAYLDQARVSREAMAAFLYRYEN